LDCSHSVCLSVSPPRFSQQLEGHVSLPHSPTAYPILQVSYPEPSRELEAPAGHAGEYNHLPTKPPTGQTQGQGKTGRHGDRARPATPPGTRQDPRTKAHSKVTQHTTRGAQHRGKTPSQTHTEKHNTTQHNTTQRARQQQRQPSSAQGGAETPGLHAPPLFFFFCTLIPSPLLLDPFLSTHGGVWAE